MLYSLTILLLGIVPTALLFLVVAMLGKKNGLHPLNILAWTMLLGYTLKSLYLAYAVAYNAPFVTQNLSRDIIPIGQIAVIVGVIGFIAGVLLFRRQNIRPDGAPYRPIYVMSKARYPELYYYPIFFVSFGLMVVYFFTMGFHEQILRGQFSSSKFFYDEEGGKSSLAFLTFGGDMVVAYFIHWLAFTKRVTIANIYVPAIAFVSLCYMLASRRNGVLMIIIATVMVIGIRTMNEKMSAKVKRWGLIAIVFVMLAFVSSIRLGGGEKSVQDLSFGGAISAAMEHSFEGAYFLDPAKTATIVDQTSAKDLFMYGESFVGAFVAPVPRILWPEKPLVRIGPLVAQMILQYDNNSGAPPGAVGEFYMNFGWLGIVFGMVTLGAFASMLYNRFESHVDKRFATPAYALFMLCIILFLVADFSLSFLYMIRYAVAIWICRQFWGKMVAQSERSERSRIGSSRRHARGNSGFKIDDAHVAKPAE